MATSWRVTFGVPPLFYIEKSKCSFDAKWLVFDRQVFHSSPDAQPPASKSAVPITTERQCFPFMARPSSEIRTARYPTGVGEAGQLAVRARLPLTTSRRGPMTENLWMP